MRSSSVPLAYLFAAGLLATGVSHGRAPVPEVKPAPNLPVVFEPAPTHPGHAQRFTARGTGYRLDVSAAEAVLHPQGRPGQPVRMRFPGAEPGARVAGVEQKGRANYLLGSDPSRWRTGVPTFGGVRVAGMYPGVDLIYYSSPVGLEYDFEVQPGADPAQIALEVETEGRAARVSPEGALELPGTDGFRIERPVVYQEVAGRRQPVAARFVADEGCVRLALAEYDRSRTLVIDPVIRFSTYLGGGGEDHALTTAIDTKGNLLVAGRTSSTDFPVVDARQTSFDGGQTDGFIAKLSGDGSTRIWVTYFGGSAEDRVNDVAVDALGNVYLTGRTTSSDFPLRNPIQQQLRGPADAFVTKLDEQGKQLLYSTYLGGGGLDVGEGIAIGFTNVAYVTGETSSTNFPVTASGFQREYGGGGSDAFVVRMAGNGRSLTYATYLGEREEENAGDAVGRIAVDAEGSAYVLGTTRSSQFPVTSRGFQRQLDGGQDAFLTKLDPNGETLEYSTFLGGSTLEIAGDLAVDLGGAAVVTGITSSPDFPVTAGAFQTEFGGGIWDSFVTRVAPSGETLSFSTFLGGRGEEGGTSGIVTVYGAIAIAPTGEFVVAGRTDSGNFPIVDPLQDERGGFFDAFICRLSSDGKSLPFSTFLGGSANDSAASLTVGPGGDVVVTGFTASQNFPTRSAGQPLFGGGIADAWLTKITGPTVPPVRPQLRVTPIKLDFGTRRVGQFRNKTLTLKNAGLTPLDVVLGSVTAPFQIVEGGGSFTLAKGKSRKVKLLFSPTAAGKSRQELEITSTDPIRELVRVILVGRGR